ncbi:hypothetical protein MOMA_08181 [Moraxella macacae 0408225]|uniref:Uncharacterized protein n=1 Tax=Moraxella macacae 0408225 TaxID=1230338 RepID=L2F641_9GAMM|nr:hypothetical protein [Moraxella macacae]ELA08524.1 hypothetical protein MOMA_08181 [Moraxella macacae 0408225]
MNPMLQNRPDVGKTDKGKMINWLTNLALLLNFGAGALFVHWVVIAVFVIAHVVLRLAYIKLEHQAIANTSPNPVEGSNPPTGVRNVATVVAMFVIANVLYWLGFGIRYGVNMFFN